MCRRVLYLCLLVYSCGIPVGFVERFVRFVIWLNIIYRSASAVLKNQSFILFSDKAIAATYFMNIVGVGTSVNCPQVIFLRERSENKS